MFFKDNPIGRPDDPASTVKEALLADHRDEIASRTDDCSGGFGAEGGEPGTESPDSKYIPKAFLKKTGVGLETSDDKFDERSASIFEPRNLGQCLTAWWQNTFEVAFLLLLFIAARFNAHFISFAIVLTSSNMVLPITMSNLSRINWGRIFNAINCVIIGSAIYYKYSRPPNQSYDTEELAKERYLWHKSCGFKIKQLKGPVKDENTGKYQYTLVLGEESLRFEWVALAVSLLAFSQYQFM